MSRGIRLNCSWTVMFFFLFFLLAPDDALCFDTDTLKTAGIVSGITLGVALIVVLVAGTVRDMKRDGGDEEEEDDVWSRSPVLRALGYRPLHDSLPGRPPSPPGGLSRKGLPGIQGIEASQAGRDETVWLERSPGLSTLDPRRPSPGDMPPGLALSRPSPDREGERPAFSLWQPGKRS